VTNTKALDDNLMSVISASYMC